MSAVADFKELFDPEFLGSLGHLSITARRVAGGGRFGERISRDLGTGMQFRDFRPYTPGDDLRSIDWNIYRRLGRVFMKLYEEQQDLPLYVMPDLSRSMFHDGASGRSEGIKIKAALRAGLAMAAISMNQNDSAGLLPFGDGLQVIARATSGKANIMAFARHLAEVEPQVNTDLPQVLKQLEGLNLRPGLLVIISDFFDPAGPELIGKALGRLRHRVLLIQVARELDANPELQGELRLRDCETGEVADLAITPAVVNRYKEAYARFSNELAAMAKKRRAGLLRLDADKDVVSQLATLFETGSLAV